LWVAAPDTVEFYRTFFGPAQNAFATLPDDKQRDLRRGPASFNVIART
jgi:hypothetical protein